MPYVEGTEANDSLNGTAEADIIEGREGNDVLRGAGGADILRGEEDNDYLIGGADDDLLDGGDGIDRAGYHHTSSALGGVTVDLTESGAQDVGGGQGFDTFVSIEYLSGTPFADDFIGTDDDNWLWGAASSIFGGASASLPSAISAASDSAQCHVQLPFDRFPDEVRQRVARHQPGVDVAGGGEPAL